MNGIEEQGFFKAALRELPNLVDYDPFTDKTIEDLVYKCKTQLDLINEGECDDIPERHIIKRQIKKFIAKHEL